MVFICWLFVVPGLLGLLDFSLLARTARLSFLKSSLLFACGLCLFLVFIEVFLGLLEICEYYLIFQAFF